MRILAAVMTVAMLLPSIASACQKCGQYGAACAYATAPYTRVLPTYEYHPDPKYPGYYLRGYKTAAGGYYTETGHWLKKDGHWLRYEVPQLGSTVYGASAERYNLALAIGYKPAVHVPQSALKAPGPHDPLSLFPDPQKTYEIEAENAFKLETLARNNNRDVQIARVNADKEAELARIAGRTTVEKWNAAERIMLIQNQQLAKFLEGGEATKEADASAIPIADDAARAAIAKNCLSCHGGSRGVKGGVDFRIPLTPEQESECKDQVLQGLMPDEGSMSLEDQTAIVNYFKPRVKSALKR